MIYERTSGRGRLYTSIKDDKMQLAELQHKLGELKQSLLELDIVLDIRLNPNMQDREIRLDNGWIIKIGRGWTSIKDHRAGLRSARTL
jgi:Phospholipase D-like domain at C-terminus of MIT